MVEFIGLSFAFDSSLLLWEFESWFLHLIQEGWSNRGSWIFFFFFFLWVQEHQLFNTQFYNLPKLDILKFHMTH